MLGDALSYPRQGDGWLKKLLIGTVLILLSVLVVPQFLVLGYLIRVLRSGASGGDEPPAFDDWVGMLIDGLLSFVVQLAYTLVPLVVVAAGVFSIGLDGATAGSAGAASGVGLGLVLLGAALALLAAYLSVAALTNFAIHDDVTKAFAVRDILAIAFTSSYFVAFVLAIVVALVLGTIAGILSVVVIGLPLLFYLQVSVYYLLARGFAEGRRKRGIVRGAASDPLA